MSSYDESLVIDMTLRGFPLMKSIVCCYVCNRLNMYTVAIPTHPITKNNRSNIAIWHYRYINKYYSFNLNSLTTEVPLSNKL